MRLGKNQKLFVLTGAGISQESGIPTFRDAGGLWEGHDVDEVATLSGWHRNPALVWRFTSGLRQKALTARPNPAHIELARIQKLMGDRFTLVTQNIDNLHEQAGSTAIHMHGSLYQSRCSRTGPISFKGSTPECGIKEDTSTYFEELPRCLGCRSLLRPHICWFEEIPHDMDKVQEALDTDIFLVVGSSGSVYPAAGLVSDARARRKDLVAIYVGLERPSNAEAFDRIELGRAGEIMPGLLEG